MPTARREHDATYVLPDDDTNGVYALFTRTQPKRAERPQTVKVGRTTARQRRTLRRALQRVSVDSVPSPRTVVDAIERGVSLPNLNQFD